MQTKNRIKISLNNVKISVSDSLTTSVKLHLNEIEEGLSDKLKPIVVDYDTYVEKMTISVIHYWYTHTKEKYPEEFI